MHSHLGEAFPRVLQFKLQPATSLPVIAQPLCKVSVDVIEERTTSRPTVDSRAFGMRVKAEGMLPAVAKARRELKQVGWTKGLEVAKIARRDRQHFDCATWLHKAREMPREDFRRAVEKTKRS